MSSFYGKYNIRVNAISPGGIYGHEAGKKIYKIKNLLKIIQKNSIKQTLLSNEVSKLALYIISSKASYILDQQL